MKHQRIDNQKLTINDNNTVTVSNTAVIIGLIPN